MEEKQRRLELIKILARNADEPHKTIDAIIDLFDTTDERMGKAKRRAIALYYAGKHGTEIAEIISDEYRLVADEIDAVVNEAKEEYSERNIPLENNHE